MIKYSKKILILPFLILLLITNPTLDDFRNYLPGILGKNFNEIDKEVVLSKKNNFYFFSIYNYSFSYLDGIYIGVLGNFIWVYSNPLRITAINKPINRISFPGMNFYFINWRTLKKFEQIIDDYGFSVSDNFILNSCYELQRSDLELAFTYYNTKKKMINQKGANFEISELDKKFPEFDFLYSYSIHAKFVDEKGLFELFKKLNNLKNVDMPDFDRFRLLWVGVNSIMKDFYDRVVLENGRSVFQNKDFETLNYSLGLVFDENKVTLRQLPIRGLGEYEVSLKWPAK